MKLILICLLLLPFQVMFGQTDEYFSVNQVDAMAYLSEDAVKITRSIRKKREKMGLPASTPEMRFLQAFYSSIRIGTETRFEDIKSYKLEFEVLVDSTGSISIGDLFFLNDDTPSKLPAPMLEDPIVVTAYFSGGSGVRRNPIASKGLPGFSTGQVDLIRSLVKMFDSFPGFVPAQLNGNPVGCRWTVHMEYRNE